MSYNHMNPMTASPKYPPTDGDQDRRATILAVVISMTLFSTATTILRVYTRIKFVHNLGWDDYTIVIAQIISLLSMMLTIKMVVHGVGRHIYSLSLEDIVEAGLFFRIVEITYVFATAIVKCSVCLFLLRIMPRGTDKWLHWSLYTLMAIMAMLSVATAIVILAQCTPLAAGWDPRVAGKCRSGSKNLGIGYAHIAWSICTDFVCALFPILILWKSQMNKRTKYALWAIMGMGVLAGICCAIKTGYLGKLSKGDFTYNGVDVNIWGPLEQNIGAIAASVPPLQPFFKSLLRRNCSPSQSKPGARNNFILSPWRSSTANALGTSSRAINNTGDKSRSDSNEYILPPVMDRLQDDEAALGVRETQVEDVKYSREGTL